MNIHEETLKIARNLIEKDPSLTDWVISKFPELKESEDERIRKALIKLVKKAGEGYENVIDGVSIENAISWLEKQDEQKSVEWSEEDEKTLNSILSCIKHCQIEDTEARYNGNRYVNPKRYDPISDWLVSIKYRHTWKPTKDQIKALEWQVANTSQDSWQYKATKELLKQLKQL